MSRGATKVEYKHAQFGFRYANVFCRRNVVRHTFALLDVASRDICRLVETTFKVRIFVLPVVRK